jgi:histidine triad (HIT) family protein
MSSIFTKIVQGEIPSYKVAETEDFYAFLDIFPLTKGHTLVIPKKEIDYIFDIEDQMLGDMMVFSRKIAKAIQTVVPCERVGVAVIGLEVPHAHIHLIPIKEMSDMDFSREKLKLEAGEFAELAQKINAAFSI